ncbi:MAG TPA: hypothetical protein VLH39_04120 [Magnetospirillaceae bacterium]|nr:hypothetical protein [Magnetospirillaceae bacterium]
MEIPFHVVFFRPAVAVLTGIAAKTLIKPGCGDIPDFGGIGDRPGALEREQCNE